MKKITISINQHPMKKQSLENRLKREFEEEIQELIPVEYLEKLLEKSEEKKVRTLMKDLTEYAYLCGKINELKESKQRKSSFNASLTLFLLVNLIVATALIFFMK